jgi:hypothetical protein
VHLVDLGHDSVSHFFESVQTAINPIVLFTPNGELIDEFLAKAAFVADARDDVLVALHHFTDNLEAFVDDLEFVIEVGEHDRLDPGFKVSVHFDRPVEAQAELLEVGFNFALAFEDCL